MSPAWSRITYKHVDVGTAIVLLLLGAVLLLESWDLGPGWGVSGPDAGFFPFVMTTLILIGSAGVLWYVYRHAPDERQFFEVWQEIDDLAKVGLPIAAFGLLVPWLGLYIMSGVYIGLFMLLYGKFTWYWSLAGAILLPVCLWLMLREGFNISMPMSVFYRTNVLPF